MDALGVVDLEPGKKKLLRVCQDHFTKNSFLLQKYSTGHGRNWLNSNAVPNQNLPGMYYFLEIIVSFDNIIT